MSIADSLNGLATFAEQVREAGDRIETAIKGPKKEAPSSVGFPITLPSSMPSWGWVALAVGVIALMIVLVRGGK